jgi:16S rRNA processing protein RimM
VADESSLVVMGRLLGPFGVQGWVKVNAFTETPGSLGAYGRWAVRTSDGWREMEVEDFAVHSKGPVAKLAGCEDREAAQRLRNAEVAVSREAMGETDEGTLYRVDLVGLEVVDEGGASVGEVEGFFDAGDTTVMVVRGEGRRERMIPFVNDYVKVVDRGARRITVHWKADYDA